MEGYVKAIYSIVGMKHLGTEVLIADMKAGEMLALVRDPLNDYDANAVQVWGRQVQLGYIKATEATSLARSMDEKQTASKLAIFAIDNRWPCAEINE